MPYLTDLADAARKSGLKVVEVAGWKTRGHGPMTAVESVIVHHTATSRTASGDYPSLGIVRDGRSDLPGPLSQLGLGRDGTVYVIAAGVSYHAGTVGLRSWDNWHAIGIEAEADGLSAWPASQMDAYARLCRALCDHYDLGPDQVLGHKEVARPMGRKIDPNFDMGAFRDAIANAGDDMTPEQAKQLADIHQWLSRDGVIRSKLDRGATLLRKLKEKGNATYRELEDLAEAFGIDDA